MGSFVEGDTLKLASEIYWLGRGDQPPPDKAEALKVLRKVAKALKDNGPAEYEIDDRVKKMGPKTGIGRLIAIALEATDAERSTKEDEDGYTPWDKVLDRFDKKLGFAS